eukprot:scaffold7639_cov258-Pinguiococcus_pyrenoidosus.AAC.8
MMLERRERGVRISTSLARARTPSVLVFSADHTIFSFSGSFSPASARSACSFINRYAVTKNKGAKISRLTMSLSKCSRASRKPKTSQSWLVKAFSGSAHSAVLSHPLA